jgi:hypothetical protein
MFGITVQAELNAMLHVCESGLQDVLTNRSNFTSNVVDMYMSLVLLISCDLGNLAYRTICNITPGLWRG